MRIDADRDLCIGSGNCVLTAEDVFDQDDSAIVVLLTETPTPAQDGRVRDAIARCPSRALSMVES
jgi:ferredoxin